MNDQLRMELIKKRHANTGIIADDDLDWLIERVEDSEKEVASLNKLLEHYQ